MFAAGSTAAVVPAAATGCVMMACAAVAGLTQQHDAEIICCLLAQNGSCLTAGLAAADWVWLPLQLHVLQYSTQQAQGVMMKKAWDCTIPVIKELRIARNSSF
jgi:hypothetical protein